MNVKMDFIPNFCPNCCMLWRDLWFDEKGYAKPALDKFVTGEPYTCRCGVVLIYSRRVGRVRAAISKPLTAARAAA